MNIRSLSHYLNTIYEKFTVNILMVKKPKAFPLRSGTRQQCLLLSHLFNIVLKVLLREIRPEEEIEGIPIGKQKGK
jgi:hypothetical protein